MARETFAPRRFTRSSEEAISRVAMVIDYFQKRGFRLTLRQLYYQFVARDLFPVDRRWKQDANGKLKRDPKGTPNAEPNYKWLGSLVSKARLAGLLDWDMIEDRTRNVHAHSTWADPAEIIKGCSEQYKEDLWRDQEYRPEVWIEKDALLGVIEPACDRWRLPYFACRGNTSQSAQYAAGKRFELIRANGQIPIVFHLGDHDPSGVDMTRDNRERLEMFARFEVEVHRLALNMDQVRQYNPPPNPAKETDTRWMKYVAEYGNESWELDALDPGVVDALIEDAVVELVARKPWDKALKQEEARRKSLEKVSAVWPAVQKYVKGLKVGKTNVSKQR